MRELGTIGIVAALVVALLVLPASVSLGQKLDEVHALTKRVTELGKAGKYAEAISL
jgi:predicted RND superfamily exporter protein